MSLTYESNFDFQLKSPNQTRFPKEEKPKRPQGRPRKYHSLEEFREKERIRVNQYHERKRMEKLNSLLTEKN